jgi:hypothetical protein
MSAGSPEGRARRPTAAEARAEVEARRGEERARREAAMRERFGDELPGRWIIVASWLCTVVFALAAVPALIDPDDAVAAFFGVSVVLFLVGCALFMVDLVLAAARSRDDAMGIGGLFFLAGSAPPRVQRHLLGSLAVQVVVAIVAAALDPFTPLAFGTLVPTIGLAFCGLWAVRHGLFPARTG